MKKINWLIISISGVLILLAGCSKKNIFEISKLNDKQLFQDNSKKIMVVGFDNAFMNISGHMTKLNREFVDNYLIYFTNALYITDIFKYLKYDKSSQWEVIKSSSPSEEQSKKVDSLLTSCQADYLLCVSNLILSNKEEHMYLTGTPGYMGSPWTPGYVGSPGHLSKKEFYNLQSQFQMYDVTTRQKVMEFYSFGKSYVSFSAYDKARINATNNSIDHAIRYLKKEKKDAVFIQKEPVSEDY